MWWRLALVAVVGAAVYSTGLAGPFVLDDLLSVTHNPNIRQWWSLAEVLSPEQDSPLAGRPLVSLSFAMNYAMAGLDVEGYHITNIAIHLCCGLLLFGIVRRTLELPNVWTNSSVKAADVAFATALLWTLHPLNSEVVNYLTQRTESMMASLYLATLYSSIRAHTRSARWQIAAITSCLLGMACKESMVTAPVMVLAYDRVYRYDSLKQAFRARGLFYLALASTWILLGAQLWSSPRGQSAGFATDVDPWTYLGNQAIMIVRYLRLTFWPWQGLVVWYGWPLHVTLRAVLPYALTITCLGVCAAIQFIRRPRFAFPAAWFFVTLAPTSSIIPIATEVGAERRMYLPLAGLLVLVVVAAVIVCDRISRVWHPPFPGSAARIRAGALRGVIPRRCNHVRDWDGRENR